MLNEKPDKITDKSDIKIKNFVAKMIFGQSNKPLKKLERRYSIKNKKKLHFGLWATLVYNL